MRRQQPQKKRKRSSSSSRTIVHTENAPLYLKVLGTSTGDSTPSVIASFSDRKYLFDCGEGLQRFCIEHRVKLKKIGKIFLTSNNVESFGGIPGMMLTIGGVHTSSSSSKEAARLDICGPIGTKRLIHASRKFCHVNPQTCQIRVADVLPSSCGGDICRDRFLNVRAIRLFNESYPKEEYISYLCTTPSSRGKFRPDRARELGVKRGPDFGKLTKGLEVRLESGTIVRPEDVMESSNPGTMFAVVRCPELSWIESLISDKDNELFWNHCRNRKEEMSCIVHMVPTSVLRNEVYSKWAASFGKNTQHIVINQDVCPQNYVHVGTARAVERKSRIVPDVFPYRLFQCSDPVLRLPIREFPQQCMGARNLLKFVLLPRSRRGIKTDEVLSSVTSGSRSGATEGVSKEKASSTITPPKNITELVFLGTSSAIPQKYRNVSGILLRFMTNKATNTTTSKCMLMDTGEGTFGQLVRLCGGVDAAEREISNLICVWISHMHADHHLGLVRVLSHFKGKDPVLVIGPAALQEWLNLVTQVHSSLKSTFTFVDANSMRTNSFRRTSSENLEYAKKRLRNVLNLSLETVPVFHPSSSSGLIMNQTLDDNDSNIFKLVYSGDTTPCKHLIEAGKNATILIHEATFEDGMESEAKKKRHSTIGQALEVGRKMNAHRIVLTHFSARYTKSSPCSTIDGIYCKASDFFCIRSDQLSRMSEYHQGILRAEKALSEEDKDDDDDNEESIKRRKLLKEAFCCNDHDDDTTTSNMTAATGII